jgi:hypothetical protein
MLDGVPAPGDQNEDDDPSGDAAVSAAARTRTT